MLELHSNCDQEKGAREKYVFSRAIERLSWTTRIQGGGALIKDNVNERWSR